MKNTSIWKGRRILSVLTALCLCCMALGGCGARGAEEDGGDLIENAEQPGSDTGLSQERTHLTAAVLYKDQSFTNMVEQFNASNQEYYVEIQVYEATEWDGSDALERLTMEILAGGGPDIIRLDEMSSPSFAAGKLLEDLYPYMEADEDFRLSDYYENVWEAFSLSGSLYTLVTSFGIDTFAGDIERLGTYVASRQMKDADIHTWSIEEMMRCYRDLSGAATGRVQLFPGDNKLSVVGDLCYSGMDQFVDWEEGTCSFEDEEFVKMLEFANSFPEGIEINDDTSVMNMYLTGMALLYPVRVTDVWSVAQAEVVFPGKTVIYPGHPVREGDLTGTGAVAYPGDGFLSMNRNSRQKEGVWLFLKSCLSKEAQRNVLRIPVLRAVSEERLESAQVPEYELVDGKEVPKVRSTVRFEGDDPVELTVVTAQNAAVFRSLVESVHRSITLDSAMYNIVLEEAGSYFAGDRTAAEAADVIQNRVSMYVGERVR